MANWEKKSAHLLREIVKFRTYMDSLGAAAAARDRVYRARERDAGDPLPASADSHVDQPASADALQDDDEDVLHLEDAVAPSERAAERAALAEDRRGEGVEAR